MPVFFKGKKFKLVYGHFVFLQKFYTNEHQLRKVCFFYVVFNLVRSYMGSTG